MNVTKLQSSTSKFKKGQIVKLVDPEGLGAKEGATALVIEVNELYVFVKWAKDIDDLSGSQGHGGYYPWHFAILKLKRGKKLKFLHKNKYISNLDYLEALNEK